MLNIGLIGKIDSLEQQVSELKNHEGVVIQGKSSVGTKDSPSEYSYSIPEYNRIELLERSDALILDDHTLLPYPLIKDAIKRNKHLFFADYPEFSNEQFRELIKLIEEAGTTIQIKNPFIYNHPIQWITKKLSSSSFIDVSIHTEINDHFNLVEVILLLLKMGDLKLKKIRPLFFKNDEKQYRFNNIRFEFDNSSVINLSLLKSSADESFIIKVFNNEEIITANVLKSIVEVNSNPVSLKSHKFSNEYDSFFKSIRKKQAPDTSLNDFYMAKNALDEIINNVAHPTI